MVQPGLYTRQRSWLRCLEAHELHGSLTLACILTTAIVGAGTYFRFFCFSAAPLPLTTPPDVVWSPSDDLQTVRDFLEAGKPPEVLLDWNDTQWCPNVPEPERPDQVPAQLPFLMILGAAKTGSTWLFDALTNHPSFEAAIRRPADAELLVTDSVYDDMRLKLLSKEPKFFNRWPPLPTRQYLGAWNSTLIDDILSGAKSDRVLLDGSPQYLMVPAAAPRVKAAVPHARFIFVVRDPPMRTFSHYRMKHRNFPRCFHNNNRLCPEGSFAETIRVELQDTEHPVECFFNSTVSDSTTWSDCFRCSFNHIENDVADVRKACHKVKQEKKSRGRTTMYPPFDCGVPHYRFVDQGKYAAQFAVWLHYFPPEQFLVISSWQLHDPIERVQVLNRVLTHVGLNHVTPFTFDMLDKAEGFTRGSYADSMLEEDQEMLRLLRRHFEKDQEDLKRLVDMLYPDLNFTVAPES